MFKNIQKFSFFFLYFIKVLGHYINGLLITNTLIMLSISRLNLISMIMFLKYNLISGFNSLLDIIVVDNINLNYHRFEVIYIFWNIYYGYRFGLKLYITKLNGIISISKYYEMLID